ncbi:hypothetical protein ACFIOY_18495 [Bradyrhizobium sp. TZ2]
MTLDTKRRLYANETAQPSPLTPLVAQLGTIRNVRIQRETTRPLDR